MNETTIQNDENAAGAALKKKMLALQIHVLTALFHLMMPRIPLEESRARSAFLASQQELSTPKTQWTLRP
jgi:hypothetical protein